MFWSWLLTALASLKSGQDLTNSQLTSTTQDTDNLRRPFVIAVEGNVGCGKSTFLNLMSALPGVETYPETVDRWQNVSGLNLLEEMYRDPNRWSTSFQLYTTLTRVQSIYEANTLGSANISLIERSLYSSRYVFVEMLRDSGLMTDGEYSLLDKWFNLLVDRNDPGMTVDHIIYIKSDPAVLGDRIKARGRQEESGLSMEFLTDLHRRHEAWLEEGSFPVPAPVTVLDGNLDIHAFTEAVKEWAENTPRLQGIL